jgi:hypothetical protein
MQSSWKSVGWPFVAGLVSVAVLAAVAICTARAEEGYDSWPLLRRTFPSTGGGGIMIGEYDPVVTGNTCATNFTAIEPNGTIHYNMVEFDAVETQGGTLCTNGRWRARDGSSSGTTPFQVFFKNGVVRGSQ